VVARGGLRAHSGLRRHLSARRAVLRERQRPTLLAERTFSLERDLELVGKRSADGGRAGARRSRWAVIGTVWIN
jgi:hypothetical protein